MWTQKQMTSNYDSMYEIYDYGKWKAAGKQLYILYTSI